MSSERVKIGLIFFVVVAVIGGGAFYFFAIFQPKQRLTEAQEAITGWEARFVAARNCLLGAKPASSKTREALAVREMSPDPWDRGTCTPLISKLSRGDAPMSGIDEVEAAWAEIDKAASGAAQAFATHITGTMVMKNDPLPAALDRLDDARAKLRAAAKLPPAEQIGKALPSATIVPLQDGSEPLKTLEVDAIPSAHGIVLFGKTDSREVQVTLVTGGTPQVGRVAPGAMRAVPDGNWGAAAGDGFVRAGTFDKEGAMPAATTIPLVGTRMVTVAAAAGTMTDGVLVYGGDNQLAIAQAKASSITADSPLRIATGVAGTDVDGRVALVWTTHDREHHARILAPGHEAPPPPAPEPAPAPVRKGAGEKPPKVPIIELTDVVSPGTTPAEKLTRPMASSTPCLTLDRAWIMFGASLVTFGGPQPPARIEGSGHLIGCTADAAILRMADGYAVCKDTCRATHLIDAPADATVTEVGGKLVAIAEHGGVLAVWREDAPVTYIGLPEPAQPVMAHEWAAMALSDGKVIDIVARGSKTFVVIRIPATGS